MPWDGNWWKGKPPTIGEYFADGDTPECDCCGTVGVPLEMFEERIGSRRREEHHEKDEPPFKALCELCSHSFVSTVWEYPEQYGGETQVIMRSMAVIGNIILKELRGQRKDTP